MKKEKHWADEISDKIWFAKTHERGIIKKKDAIEIVYDVAIKNGYIPRFADERQIYEWNGGKRDESNV